MPAVLKIALAVLLSALACAPAASAKTCTKRTTGVCTSNGNTIKLANRAQTLKLKSVAVKIVGSHMVVPTLGPFDSHFGDEIATAKGRYVVFVVKVTNRGGQPIDTIVNLDFGLILGGATYDASFEAESLIGAPSLIHDGENNTIQPGLSSTGYIAFDVARNRTALVRKNGNLLVKDDSDKRIGQIRTYR